MGRRSQRAAEGIPGENVMKAGQMKGLQIHNTLSQVLGVRNSSTFRIFQLLDRLYLCILCNINIRGWGRTL